MHRLPDGRFTLIHRLADQPGTFLSVVDPTGAVSSTVMFLGEGSRFAYAINGQAEVVVLTDAGALLTMDLAGTVLHSFSLPPAWTRWATTATRLRDGTLAFSWCQGPGGARGAQLMLASGRGDWSIQDISCTAQTYVNTAALAQHPLTGALWLVTDRDASGQFAWGTFDPGTFVRTGAGTLIYAAYQGMPPTIAPNPELTYPSLWPRGATLVLGYSNANGLYYAEDFPYHWPEARPALTQLPATPPTWMSPSAFRLLAEVPEDVMREWPVPATITPGADFLAYKPILGVTGSADPAVAGSASNLDVLYAHSVQWRVRALVNSILTPPAYLGEARDIAVADDAPLYVVFEDTGAVIQQVQMLYP